MRSKNCVNEVDVVTRVVCLTAFCVFTFLYVMFFQADLLTVVQHILSRGATHYNHFVGAVVITFVLQLLQIGIGRISRAIHTLWALTYVPSFLCLIALTSAYVTLDGSVSFGSWKWLLPVCLIASVILLWTAGEGLVKFQSEDKPVYARKLWINLLIMLIGLLTVCGLGNCDKVFHVRAHMEQCLLNGDNDAALSASSVSNIHDKNIMMLTALALSKKNQLGERLFEYELCGGAESLLPDGKNTSLLIYPDSAMYSHLGGWYVQRMSTEKYLDYLKRHGRLNKFSVDYLLCSYLLNRDIDSFAHTLKKFYEINDSLPKHYKEALLLYSHKRANPCVVYSNNVMNADFQDFRSLEISCKNPLERQTKLRDSYGNTYWYYYQY